MRLHAKQLLGTAAVVALAFPVWGRTVSFHSDGNTTVGQTQLKAGDYDLKVKDNASQMEVTRDGKVIAEVPITWVQLQNTPQDTEVVLTENRVVEVDFGGKTQAVKVESHSAANPNASGQSASQQ
jgi:hypothetical protein